MRRAALLLLLLALASCGSPATEIPVRLAPGPTRGATSTRRSTAAPTRRPTITPWPTSSRTPIPTFTTQPTSSPVPATAAAAPVRAATVPAPTAGPVSWRCPADLSGAAVVGNSNSMKFHTPAHTISSGVSPDHRVCFRTREAAIAAGYVACKTCKP